MLSERERRLVRALSDICDMEVQKAANAFLMECLSEPPPSPGSGPWKPKVGETVEVVPPNSPRFAARVAELTPYRVAIVELPGGYRQSWSHDYLRPAAAAPSPEAWVPKVGDRVVLTDGINDEEYTVVRVENGRCKLDWGGTLQDGWFDFASLAPAKPAPTAEEMMAYLCRTDRRIGIRRRGRYWRLRRDGENILGWGSYLDFDVAVRIAMRLEAQG